MHSRKMVTSNKNEKKLNWSNTKGSINLLYNRIWIVILIYNLFILLNMENEKKFSCKMKDISTWKKKKEVLFLTTLLDHVTETSV